MKRDYMVMVEQAAEATWLRCRSLPERKAKTTWLDLTEAERDAWRDGAKVAFIAAGVPELLCEWQEYNMNDTIIERLDPNGNQGETDQATGWLQEGYGP